MARKMIAKFPGCCRGCGKGIEPGDSICHAGSRKNFHAGCYDGRAGGPATAAAEVEVRADNARASTTAFDGNYDVADEFAWGLS